ncbi:alpha/beta hydrolase [Agriterribacter sp.]|uniref:alpha/beta hydrolase n=1 Tax=Agriterribacter sp. TaxID=2821509 RepID=UPI002B7A21C2|nr:alpha/beta hydrolase [Agriterribacter sp.]HTN08002.1 alpha/beta hydrolase [Agriterribacter sp.]
MSLKLPAGLLMLMLVCHASFAQQTIPLYEKNIPGALNVPNEERYDSVNAVAFKVFTPTLTVYLPQKENANGAAVVICPGGGYGGLVMGKEGFAIAEYFAKQGVAAFVLKYRLPDDRIMKDKSTGPLQDAQQAIKLIKQHARQWNVDTARVGIMGFSAGGHLASTAGTHFNHPVIAVKPQVSVRPDFMILVYPVISMTDSLGHRGSRNNLLGKNPSPQKIQLFSSELQVTAQTPPAFLIHAGDDKAVDVDNSISFYEALRHNKVPAEMHIYPKGDHGFVLKMPVEEWMSICIKWMRHSGFL